MELKVGIICAGDSEFEPFISCIKGCIVTTKAMLKIHEGTINDIKVVALFSGVCKVNAAIATQILIDCYHANIIINSGTAGGMDENLTIFDTVIATEVAYHDVDEEILTEFHPWMHSIYFSADKQLLRLSQLAINKMKHKHRIYFGRMVTGEAFILEDGRKAINETYKPLSVDMETASIGHVCYVNEIPFIAIRTITDTATDSGIGHFEENCRQASKISQEITLALLNEIKQHYL